nr:hypothetical protein [Tanacetum cinerariifolium]
MILLFTMMHPIKSGSNVNAKRKGRGVVIGISRPLSRVVTGATVIITTVMDLTEIPVMGVTRETGVNSPTDLPILAIHRKSSKPGVPLRATHTQFALLVDVDTQESVVELLADKKPGASGRVFAITEGHAANTS